MVIGIVSGCKPENIPTNIKFKSEKETLTLIH